MAASDRPPQADCLPCRLFYSLMRRNAEVDPAAAKVGAMTPANNAAVAGEADANAAAAGPKDCLECKIVGTSAMIGTGTYILYQRHLQYPKNKHAWAAIAACFYAAGLYRATMKIG